MATEYGTIKRVELEQFSNVRSNGLRAIELNGDDTLIGVAITDGEQQIMLFSNEGKAIRFAETTYVQWVVQPKVYAVCA